MAEFSGRASLCYDSEREAEKAWSRFIAGKGPVSRGHVAVDVDPDIIIDEVASTAPPAKRRRIASETLHETGDIDERYAVIGTVDLTIDGSERLADRNQSLLQASSSLPVAVALHSVPQRPGSCVAVSSSDLVVVEIKRFTEAEPSVKLSLHEVGGAAVQLVRLLGDLRFFPAESMQPPSPVQSRGHVAIRSSITLSSDDDVRTVLRLEILWELTTAWMPKDAISGHIERLWTICLPELYRLPAKGKEDGETVVGYGWSNSRAFYNAVHTPSPDTEVSDSIQSSLLKCDLYPYQRRTVQWLLRREGVHFEGNKLRPRPVGDVDVELPPSFRRFQSRRHGTFYASKMFCTVTKDKALVARYRVPDEGGILAEEMGLGKTVELISLIALNDRPPSSLSIRDPFSGENVLPSRATLIVTPKHLLGQWQSEIAKHAPSFTVYHYEGASRSSNEKGRPISAAELLDYDVVLTTYPVLTREVHFANPRPDRKLRRPPKEPPQRSPLVQISWWRVCLDEAQMIESKLSQAAKVARLIPRVYAWAVTGTPIKKDIDDLKGLLTFLRFGLAGEEGSRYRLDKVAFHDIFNQLALRHNKSQIAHELRLPPQKRVVITVPFTAIEEQNYIEQFRAMCEDCGFDLDGTLKFEDPDPDKARKARAARMSRMNDWLRRLRQTCLHPQVGERNRQALWKADGPLRTVAQVLRVMTEQNESQLRAEERQLVTTMVTRGHIIAYALDNPDRNVTSLEIYKQALAKADALVAQYRADVALEENIAREKKTLLQNQGKDDSASEDEVEDTKKGKNGRLVTTQRGLTLSLLVQHLGHFFVASAYFRHKSDDKRIEKDSPEYKELERLETHHYDAAQDIRHEMLAEPRDASDRAIQYMDEKTPAKGYTDIPPMPEIEDYGGIESRKILDQLEQICRRLVKQAQLIKECRDQIVKRLRQPLVDEDKDQDLTGEEYEDSTKVQDQLYVHMTVLRILVADRSFHLSGQQNFRAEQEFNKALGYAKEGKGHDPELLIEWADRRIESKPRLDHGSIRGVIGQFRNLATELDWSSQRPTNRANLEIGIAENHLRQVQEMSSTQVKVVTHLEKELELFHMIMNTRIEFYRQLQTISDTVIPYKEEMDKTLDKKKLKETLEKEASTAARVDQLRTKARFLLHLKDEEVDKSEGKMCVICQEPFENGILTVCGHVYCKDCFLLWHRSHKSCPLCKKQIRSVDFQEVTYKPQEIQAQEEVPYSAGLSAKDSTSPQTSSVASPAMPVTDLSSTAIYSSMSTKTLSEIKSIELAGSYGSKIDTLTRHIIWLREQDPGAKSIFFSQYGDFLKVLSDAFKQFGIGHTAITSVGGIEKFRQDPAMECFLLDAKSNSSGLNLVNATHIFLCEPLINTALELQAIARVHRIGQQRPTTVYMYLVRDTVEEAIYDISVTRRMEHIQQNSKGKGRETAEGSRATSRKASPSLAEVSLDKANSLELGQSAIASMVDKHKSGGEIVKNADLWNCLFGKSKVARDEQAVLIDQAEMQREYEREARAQAAERRIAIV